MQNHSAVHDEVAPPSSRELTVEVALLGVSMALVIGVNSLMCAVLFSHRRHMTPSYVLLFNLSVTGLFLAVVVMPLHLYVLLTDADWTSSWVCRADGHVIAICSLAMIISHVLIAVTRCASVTAPGGLVDKALSRRGGRCSVCATWMLSALLEFIGTTSGVIRPGYSAIYRTCTPTDMYSMDGVIVSISFIVGVPFIVICYCYARLVLTVRRQVDVTSKHSTHYRHRLRRFSSITRTLILLSMVFVAGWVPMLAVCSSDRDHSRFQPIWHRLAHDSAEVTLYFYPFMCFLCIVELRQAVCGICRCSGRRYKSGHDSPPRPALGPGLGSMTRIAVVPMMAPRLPTTTVSQLPKSVVPLTGLLTLSISNLRVERRCSGDSRIHPVTL